MPQHFSPPNKRLITALFLGTVLITTLFLFSYNDDNARRAIPGSPTPVNLTSVPVAAEDIQIIVARPVSISIPKILVQATIEPVGVTAEGEMATPSRPAHVAWYEPGGRPGESGTSVMAGHLDWKDGASAVFARLHELEAGDEIVVTDEQGLTTIFVVSRRQTYDRLENPNDVFTSADSDEHLNLITCIGTWNTGQQSYSNRLVVFANKQ